MAAFPCNKVWDGNDAVAAVHNFAESFRDLWDHKDAAYQTGWILIKVVSEICIFFCGTKTNQDNVCIGRPPPIEFTEAKHLRNP